MKAARVNRQRSEILRFAQDDKRGRRREKKEPQGREKEAAGERKKEPQRRDKRGQGQSLLPVDEKGTG